MTNKSLVYDPNYKRYKGSYKGITYEYTEEFEVDLYNLHKIDVNSLMKRAIDNLTIGSNKTPLLTAIATVSNGELKLTIEKANI
jgi:hypothetical protein